MISLENRQELSLNQYQILSLDILTKTSDDLAKMLVEKSESNPLMKLDFKNREKCFSQYQRTGSGFNTTDYNSYIESIGEDTEDLYTHILNQFENIKGIKPEEEEIGKLIISNLTKRGFLKIPMEELLENTDIPKKNEIYLNVKKTISALDPPGCAANNVFESLQIQLELSNDCKSKNGKLAAKLINNDDFDSYSKGHIANLSKKYKTDAKSIDDAFAIIKKLNPSPGSLYNNSNDENIAPAIKLNDENGSISITVKDDMLPEISIDETYAGVEFKGKDKVKIRKYENEIKKIEILLENRKQNLSKIAFFMINTQLDYIHGKSKSKRPLILKTIAENVNLDISTVSRIINSNYILYHNKAIPLSDLTERENDSQISTSYIQNAIQEIIGSSEKKPSDEKIRLILAEKGINIARRTVQKYRSQLNISSSFVQKPKDK